MAAKAIGRVCAVALTGAWVAGCAGTAARPDSRLDAAAAGGTLDRAVAELRAGHPERARTILARDLRLAPDNGYLHLLNALSYDLQPGSPDASELASVGYQSAARLAPGYYWAHYLDGTAALRRQLNARAAEEFAAAVQADPSHPEAFIGLAVAAYSAGDLEVAARAANRALALAPAYPAAVRTAAFIAAAEGDTAGLVRLRTAAHAVPAIEQDLTRSAPRLAQLLRAAQLAQLAPPPGTPAGGAPPSAPSSAAPPAAPPATPAPGQLNQISVDVTLLLSQNQATNRTGINLLDGLAVQFGGQQSYKRDTTSGGNAANGLGGAAELPTPVTTVEHTLTSQLTIPQITYTLNLFNTADDYYEVIARPSLVASLGQTSDFFIGRTVTIAVSGINLGSLQPIDVGTSVKITPSEITPEATKFRVEVQRSFFSSETGGTFQQTLTTFKQVVDATVEVKFGQTLILSGLYEAVNVGNSSRVPVLGRVPIAGELFNGQQHTRRHDAALVLVTPRVPGLFDTGEPHFRTETINRLLELWNRFVLPTGGLDATLRILELKEPRFHPLAGDLRAPGASDPALLAQVLSETVARLD